MKITKKSLIWIVFGWIILTLFNYYFMIPFFITFEILGLILFFLVGSIVQLVKLFKERRTLSAIRILKTIIFLGLLFLTVNQPLTNRAIEKVDWKIFYAKRMEVVEKVLNEEIQSTTDKNFWIYKLPYRFPVISNGGNDVFIKRNDTIGSVTVEFYISRNYHDSPSPKFVYTTDPEYLSKINRQIKTRPEKNWKIQRNWYRYNDRIYN